MEVLRDHLDYIGRFNYQNLNTIDKALFDEKTEEVISAYDLFNASIKDETKLKEETSKHFMMS